MSRNLSFEIPAELSQSVAAVLSKGGGGEQAKRILESVKKHGASEVTIYPSFSEDEDWSVDIVLNLAAACKSRRTLASSLKAYAGLLENPIKARVVRLELLPEAMIKYLAHGAIDGWVYKAQKDGVHVAYAVKDVSYEVPYTREVPPYVQMRLLANRASYDRSNDRLHEISVTWHSGDIVKKNAAECLASEGYLKETAELKDDYLEAQYLFEKFHAQHNKQFICRNMALDTNPSWRTDELIPLPHDTKMVNDDELVERRIQLDKDAWFWRDKGVERGFDTVPVHPYILMFDLQRHNDCWVHATNCEPYVYDPSLKEKLVLPQNHRDLIEILTTDMDAFVDDVIKGKSGGTAILSVGPPGTGKTLTAEVYSEVIERPLYKVHAGQLGVTTEEVEKALEDILRRAERWGAVLLLDEADVYIRRRDNDINRNAVVAAFLRTLEYFHGLMFLTTNRGGDVDDAIQSRMIATFKYEKPTPEDAKLIWAILSKQFGVKLGKPMVAELVKQFPEASGRDIKQLLKLTQKYCRKKGVEVEIESFRVCAMFQGVI